VRGIGDLTKEGNTDRRDWKRWILGGKGTLVEEITRNSYGMARCARRDRRALPEPETGRQIEEFTDRRGRKKPLFRSRGEWGPFSFKTPKKSSDKQMREGRTKGGEGAGGQYAWQREKGTGIIDGDNTDQPFHRKRGGPEASKNDLTSEIREKASSEGGRGKEGGGKMFEEKGGCFSEGDKRQQKVPTNQAQNVARGEVVDSRKTAMALKQ